MVKMGFRRIAMGIKSVKSQAKVYGVSPGCMTKIDQFKAMSKIVQSAVTKELKKKILVNSARRRVTQANAEHARAVASAPVSHNHGSEPPTPVKDKEPGTQRMQLVMSDFFDKKPGPLNKDNFGVLPDPNITMLPICDDASSNSSNTTLPRRTNRAVANRP